MFSGARPDDALAILRDYDHHSCIYPQEVTYSKLMDQEGTRYHVLHVTLTRSLMVGRLAIEPLIRRTAMQAGDRA